MQDAVLLKGDVWGGAAALGFLSRMNIAVSNVLIQEGIRLSESQSEKLKKLSELSNIRYVY